VAEVVKVPQGRLRNRRKALEAALGRAQTGRERLAAAAAYFRSAFVLADEETATRAATKLIELTDRETGERP